jgi:hypothetical protein
VNVYGKRKTVASNIEKLLRCVEGRKEKRKMFKKLSDSFHSLSKFFGLSLRKNRNPGVTFEQSSSNEGFE